MQAMKRNELATIQETEDGWMEESIVMRVGDRPRVESASNVSGPRYPATEIRTQRKHSFT
jgi:hypothetical protein